MTNPYQWPWVEFGSLIFENIDSSETLLYTATNATIFDCIILTNKTENEIFVDFRILGAGREVVSSSYLSKKRLIGKSESIEILPTPQSIVTLQPGDFAYANSDFSGNIFDCIISYRRLREIE